MGNNNFTPKVSIVIPVYNGSNYLAEAIDSALNQTYHNIEIIVINDGSNDNGKTAKIAKSYGDKIRYYEKENGGVATALNLGIEKMTGEYFSWLSHDDMYKPDRIEKMIKRVSGEKTKNDLIIASSYTYFDETTSYSPPRMKEYAPSHPLSYLFLGYINGCSILIPKLVLDNNKHFDEKRPTTQDFEFWFRLLRKNRLIYLKEELTLSRSHDGQGSKAFLKEHIDECDELWISMMKGLSHTEKIEIFGDEPNFYNTIYNFLKSNTLYYGAIYYAKKRVLGFAKEKIVNDGHKPTYIDSLTLRMRDHKKTIFFPIFGHYSDRAGLNKMIAMVANGLSEEYNVIVASFTGKEKGYPLGENVTYIKISTEFLGIDSFEDISIMLDVDIVVVSHNCSKSGLELISRMKSINKKVIAWNHEDYFLPYIRPEFCEVWALRRQVFKDTDVVLWLTNTSCAAYSQRFNNGYAMPNFVRFEDTRQEKRPKVDRHHNIIAVGRFDDPRKRLYKLLECYEIILESKPDVTLTILGVIDARMTYKNNENIGQAVERININGGHIEVVGFVNDVSEYYSKSDIHILPSFVEGFGLTILESAYYGVPSVVFDNSGFDDIIVDGKDGIIVPEADTGELARRVVELLGDNKKLNEMKKSSLNIISKFDENDIIKKWIELINSVLYDKNVKFSRYKYNKRLIQKLSNNFENSLIEYSVNFIKYYQSSERIKELYDRVLISRTWKYTQAAREGAAIIRKLKTRLLK